MQRHQEQNESIRDLSMQVVEKEGMIENLTRQLEEAESARAGAQANVERLQAELTAAQENGAPSAELAGLEEAIHELTRQNVDLTADLEQARAEAAQFAEKAARYEELMGRLKEML